MGWVFVCQTIAERKMPGRDELRARVNEKLPEGKKLSPEAIKAWEEAIIDSVKKGERVILQGFGTFERKDSAARKARDPRNGSSIDVPAKRKLHFRPGDVTSKL